MYEAIHRGDNSRYQILGGQARMAINPRALSLNPKRRVVNRGLSSWTREIIARGIYYFIKRDTRRTKRLSIIVSDGCGESDWWLLKKPYSIGSEMQSTTRKFYKYRSP